MQKILLEARRVTRRGVLKSIDLTVYEGDCTAILGAPGAGGSTLLRILGFQEPPDSGDLLWLGRLITPGTPADLAAMQAEVRLVTGGGPWPDPLPRLLLADEPDGALVGQGLPRGRTLVLATKDPEVAVLGDRLFRLQDGILRPIR